MTYTKDDLRRLQNYYKGWMVPYLFKYADEVASVGRPEGDGRWVDRHGEIYPSECMPEVWGSGDAALILRPERRKAKVTQFVFTPLAATPRFLKEGEWCLTTWSGSMGMFICDVYGRLKAVPYKRTEVEIEVEEDAL